MIINEKIFNAKVEEFRRYYGVTYVDEEMHKDKNLERYYMNKYPMPNNEFNISGNLKNVLLILAKPIIKWAFKCTNPKSPGYKLIDECTEILKEDKDGEK